MATRSSALRLAAQGKVATRAAKRAREGGAAAAAAPPAPPRRRKVKRVKSRVKARAKAASKGGAGPGDELPADEGGASGGGVSGVPAPLGNLPLGLTAVVDESLLCPICSEVLSKPKSGPCAHAFCGSCLASWMSRTPGTATCPVCRAALPTAAAATAVTAQLASTVVACTCGVAVRLSAARAHLAKCTHAAAVAAATAAALQRGGGVIAGVGPAAEALAAAPPGAGGPNRSTFTCPLCPPGAPAAHLDCASLVEHCAAVHAGDPRPAVCPVCAAMPWGDPSYVSRQFTAHVAHRHKFEYGTFATYDEDEDAVMRRVLEESAREAGDAAGGAAVEDDEEDDE